MGLAAHDIWTAWRERARRRRAIAKQLGLRPPSLAVLMDRVWADPEVRLVDGSSREGPAAAWLERRGYLTRIGTQVRVGKDVPIRIVTEEGLALAKRARELGW